MDRAIFVALSGAVSQEKRIEVLAENLSNVNTPGFKKQKPLFEDAMPKAVPLRVFSRSKGLTTDLSQGVTEKTERPLDVAILGDGFFSVETPLGIRYTRDGGFRVSREGALTTGEGYKVQGENGEIRLSGSNVVIEGDVTIREKGENGAVLNRIRLVSFSNPSVLKREGNYFAAVGVPAGAPTGAAELIQGSLESSNVNPVRAMTTMIEAVRSYETQAKLIQTVDDMTRRAVDEVGKV